MGEHVARKRRAITSEVAEEMRGQGVVVGHGAGLPSPLLWIPKAEEIPNATTDVLRHGRRRPRPARGGAREGPAGTVRLEPAPILPRLRRAGRLGGDLKPGEATDEFSTGTCQTMR